MDICEGPNCNADNDVQHILLTFSFSYTAAWNFTLNVFNAYLIVAISRKIVKTTNIRLLKNSSFLLYLKKKTYYELGLHSGHWNSANKGRIPTSKFWG